MAGAALEVRSNAKRCNDAWFADFGSSASAAPAKKKLSYLEAREYATIELRVEEAEQLVQGKRAELEDPANATNASLLVSTQADLDSAQDALDALYTRWAELEKKSG